MYKLTRFFILFLLVITCISVQAINNMDGFEFTAHENETKTFRQPVDLAYGANGHFHFIENFTGTITFNNQSFGGDPIRGIAKAGFVKPRNYNQHNNQNMNGYRFIANENESKTFRRPVDLAYGAQGKFLYIYGFKGTIRFDNQTFGGDPIKGVTKAGYYKSHNNTQQDVDFNDYEYIAKENQSRTFHQPVDLAYGAQGQYYYIDGFVGTIRFNNETFGGDPIEGVDKAGYVKKSQTSNTNQQSIEDYTIIAKENESKTFTHPVDLAYGTDGRYLYINGFTGTIRFDNRTFGGDPYKGRVKAGYVKRQQPLQSNTQQISDYQVIAQEKESKTFRHPVDLAYGTKGRFLYINDFTGTIRFDNRTFGGDPYPGEKKQGYVRNTRLRR